MSTGVLRVPIPRAELGGRSLWVHVSCPLVWFPEVRPGRVAHLFLKDPTSSGPIRSFPRGCDTEGGPQAHPDFEVPFEGWRKCPRGTDVSLQPLGPLGGRVTARAPSGSWGLLSAALLVPCLPRARIQAGPWDREKEQAAAGTMGAWDPAQVWSPRGRLSFLLPEGGPPPRPALPI